MGILARWQGPFDLIGRLRGEDKRGEVVFPGQAMTVAVVDRLVHYATIFEINVEGYRLPPLAAQSLNLALIDMNGSYVGGVENGGAFYRDVPPGHYHIAPESFGRDFNQDRNVDLAPGQQLYVKSSLDSWGVSVSASKNIARDGFDAWVIPPEVAQAEIARDRSGI